MAIEYETRFYRISPTRALDQKLDPGAQYA